MNVFLGRTVVLGLLAGVAATCSAEIYRRVDAFGNVTFTNLPPAGAASTAPAGKKKLPPAADAAASQGSPRISQAEQQDRDIERRQILAAELAREQESLSAAAARKDSASVDRHHANIEALQREIARIK